jgi:hypothetical protein
MAAIVRPADTEDTEDTDVVVVDTDTTDTAGADTAAGADTVMEEVPITGVITTKVITTFTDTGHIIFWGILYYIYIKASK